MSGSVVPRSTPLISLTLITDVLNLITTKMHATFVCLICTCPAIFVLFSVLQVFIMHRWALLTELFVSLHLFHSSLRPNHVLVSFVVASILTTEMVPGNDYIPTPLSPDLLLHL